MQVAQTFCQRRRGELRHIYRRTPHAGTQCIRRNHPPLETSAQQGPYMRRTKRRGVGVPQSARRTVQPSVPPAPQLRGVASAVTSDRCRPPPSSRSRAIPCVHPTPCSAQGARRLTTLRVSTADIAYEHTACPPYIPARSLRCTARGRRETRVHACRRPPRASPHLRRGATHTTSADADKHRLKFDGYAGRANRYYPHSRAASRRVRAPSPGSTAVDCPVATDVNPPRNAHTLHAGFGTDS